MTVNEPGVVARRLMTISHPLAAEWPRWLRLWWGQIQPPDLLLRIGAFPTLTRLPSPALFPALALEALSRVHTFVGGSLPFLNTGAAEMTTPATPRLDVRLRRPRAQIAQPVPVLDARGDGEPHHSTQVDFMQGVEHPPVRLEHEPMAQAHSLTIEDVPVSEDAPHETPPERSLTPFQESEWEPLGRETEHAPSLGESVQQLEEWREGWNRAEAPQLIERGIGVIHNRLVPSVPVPMDGLGAPARVMTSALAEPLAHPVLPVLEHLSAPLHRLDAPASAAQLPEALTESGVQAMDMPAASVSRAGTTLQAPDGATRAARPISSESPQLPGPVAGEARVLPEMVDAGTTQLLAEQSQPSEHAPAQTFTTFAASGAMPAAQALLTPQFSPLVGEVLHRQERAIESLSLIGHAAAPVAAPELPAGIEHDIEFTQPLSTEHGVPVATETPLPQHAQPAEMVVHSPHAEETTSAFPASAVLIPPAHETLAAPAQAELVHSADQARQSRASLAEAAMPAEDTAISRGIAASQPSLELRRPLTSVAPRMALNALQLPYFPARVEDTGIASLFSLPGLLPRHDVTTFAAQTGEVREPLVNLTEHADSFAAAEMERVFRPRTDETALAAATRTLFGFAPGLTLPAHELTHGEHPLALRPLPNIAHLLPAIHALNAGAQGGGQPPNLNLAQEPLSAPHMELRHESPAASSLALLQNGGQAPANWPWANEPAAGLAPEQHAAAQPAALAAPETAEGSGEGGGVWQGGSAPAAAPSAPLDVDAIARQVLSMLQSQLRAERDRHQIYDR